jgi:hypothetical protein
MLVCPAASVARLQRGDLKMEFSAAFGSFGGSSLSCLDETLIHGSWSEAGYTKLRLSWPSIGRAEALCRDQFQSIVLMDP